MSQELTILAYPDPRLRRPGVTVERFDDELRRIAARMFELMREARGVGLAAPQVGLPMRLFVMNHSQQPGDDRIIVNPVLLDPTGEELAEEGCLSLPNITTSVTRPTTITLEAQDEFGQPIRLTQTGYVARIWQHECDHLNGVLIIDRAGPSAKMLVRPALRELEAKWADAHPQGRKPKARSKVRR